MENEEKLNTWLESHDGEDYCEYCIYDDEYPHGMTCYGVPIEPYCVCHEPEEYLDTDAILNEM